MKTVIILLAALYILGVTLFTLYAAVFQKGWNGSYGLGFSIRYGLRWPATVARLLLKRKP